MARQCHTHRPQTYPCHHEEETHHIENHTTANAQLKTISTVFPSNMFSKLEKMLRTISQINPFKPNIYELRTNTKIPHSMGATTNNRYTTTWSHTISDWSAAEVGVWLGAYIILFVLMKHRMWFCQMCTLKNMSLNKMDLNRPILRIDVVTD